MTTPLLRKLGIKPDFRLAFRHAPEKFATWLGPLPEGATVTTDLPESPDIVVVFATEAAVLENEVLAAAPRIFPNGAIWAAWPKRSAKVPTDITEDTVRTIALPRGLVDNKVCAISDLWSGLRVVWRKEHRKGSAPPDLDP